MPARPVVLISRNPDLREMEALVESLGASTVGRVVQARRPPDPATWLGSGKLEEVRGLLADRAPLVSDGDLLLIANGELKPSQVFNLEEALGVEVWDRIRLILEIFQSKANVQEARLQVELARLRWELPFVHEAVHRQRTGEHPGYMSGGEYEVRTYETQLRRRQRRIAKELERIRTERRGRRTGRRSTGFRLVAIAGYTNAGKSQLLNTLCDADALVEPRYFSTLQTRTRRLRSEYAAAGLGPTLFTDTVGFIRGLPPWLIDAFASTLEESVEADCVVLLVDLTDSVDLMTEKLETALGVLTRSGTSSRIVIFFNKHDQLSREEEDTKLHFLYQRPEFSRYNHVIGSGRTGDGLPALLDAIRNVAPPLHLFDLLIDITQTSHAGVLSWIQDHVQILQKSRNGNIHLYRVECNANQVGTLLRRAQKAGVKVLNPLST